MFSWKTGVCALCVILLSAALCVAQQHSDYRLHGKIVDLKGKPIPAAKLILKDTEEGKMLVIKVKPDGTFDQRFVPHGVYSVSIEAEGYNTKKIPSLDLSQWGEKEIEKQIDIQMKTPQEEEQENMDKKIREDYVKGVESFKAQKWNDAIASMELVVKEAPDKYGPYLIMAACYDALNQPDKAVANYEKTISLKSDIADAHLYLAGCYIKLKNYEKAIAFYKSYLDLKPTDLDANCTLAHLYAATDKMADAETIIKHAIEVSMQASGQDPAVARCYRVDSDVLLKKSDYKGAAVSLRKYLELNPNAPDRKEMLELIPVLEQTK